MARRHVLQYFCEIEDQYNEMMSLIPVYKEMAQEGAISPEDYKNNLEYIDRLKENYERIAFIVMLLNKPNRKDKSEDRIMQSWYDALKFSSKEAIMDENRDCLSYLKETIRKVKEENE